MKKEITKNQQSYINSLLRKRKERELSKTENELKSKNQDIENMGQYDWDNKIGPYCQDRTYLEIEQFDNQYNNFK